LAAARSAASSACALPVGQVGQLAGLQCQQLVASLCCLQGTRGGLARRNEAAERFARTVDIGNCARLDLEGIFEGRHAVLPARLGAVDHRLLRGTERNVLVVQVESALDGADIVGDALGFVQQSLGLLDLVLQGLHERERQAFEISRFVDERVRLVLEHAYLVVDLLERARSGQDVLRVIGRIVDDSAELGVCGR